MFFEINGGNPGGEILLVDCLIIGKNSGDSVSLFINSTSGKVSIYSCEFKNLSIINMLINITQGILNVSNTSFENVSLYQGVGVIYGIYCRAIFCKGTKCSNIHSMFLQIKHSNISIENCLFENKSDHVSLFNIGSSNANISSVIWRYINVSDCNGFVMTSSSNISLSHCEYIHVNAILVVSKDLYGITISDCDIYDSRGANINYSSHLGENGIGSYSYLFTFFMNYSSGKFEILNVRFVNSGAAVIIISSSVMFEFQLVNCSFFKTFSTFNIFNFTKGSLNCSNNTFSDCHMGAYFKNSSISLSYSRFYNCSSDTSGGAISCINPQGIYLNSCIFEICHSTLSGGAIYISYLEDLGNYKSIEDVIFMNCESLSGSGNDIFDEYAEISWWTSENAKKICSNSESPRLDRKSVV
jgi:hypothetical protein